MREGRGAMTAGCKSLIKPKEKIRYAPRPTPGYTLPQVPPEFSDNTTLGLGGPSERWIRADSEEQLITAASDCEGELFVLGGGSNLVVADDGFAGTVIQVRSSGMEESARGKSVVVRAAAGENWDGLVALTVAQGVAGLECLSGIPGTVGAAPIQNIGAYGPELEDAVRSVRAYDRLEKRIVILRKDECGFGYRTSRFKREENRFIVLEVEFKLQAQDHSLPIEHEELAETLDAPVAGTAPLGEVRKAVLELRSEKGMVLDPSDPDTRSTGSFFINPQASAEKFAEVEAVACNLLGEGAEVPHSLDADGNAKLVAAWLIEKAGIKKGQGDRRGIAVSRKHVLALTNRGRGTTAELIDLAGEIVAAVQQMWGITLEPEPVFVGLDWPPAVDQVGEIAMGDT